MDENYIRSLDHEYEQFLEIMKPHIRQLQDQRLASMCTAWIKRLSASKDHEKVLRNKYMISLCYQLSKGNLDEPFLKEPVDEELHVLPIFGRTSSDESSESETECHLMDSEDVNSKVCVSDNSSKDIDSNIKSGSAILDPCQLTEKNKSSPCHFYKYRCPEISKNYKNIENLSDNYEYRTNNIITKLREIKKQNVFMHNKLQELKEKSGGNDRVDKHLNNTSSSSLNVRICDSNYTLGTLKSKLKEVQDVRHSLVDKIKTMQNRIDNFNEIKNQEIEKICAKHNLEINNVKSTIKEEISRIFEMKLKNLKQEYEAKIKKLQNKNTESIHAFKEAKGDNHVAEHLNNTSSSALLMRICGSNFTVGSLKSQLKEAQDIKKSLVDKIKCMQKRIDDFKELKNQEIEKIFANHKLEIINVKSSVKEEITRIFEIKLTNQKQEYEAKIEEMQNKNTERIQQITSAKDAVITQKDKIIKQRESEIVHLSEQIKCNKENLHSVATQMLENHKEEHNHHVTLQNQALEKRIHKMEREKIKYTKAFESKIATLQREKHLVECSLQIQLVHQRAQVVSGIVGDCQNETKKAVDRLEARYQDIVASIQATAIQRRLEDQMAVASILQAASGIQTDTCSMPTSDFSSNTVKSNKTHCHNSEVVSWCQGNKRCRGKYVPHRDTDDNAQK